MRQVLIPALLLAIHSKNPCSLCAMLLLQHLHVAGGSLIGRLSGCCSSKLIVYSQGSGKRSKEEVCLFNQADEVSPITFKSSVAWRLSHSVIHDVDK